MENQSIIHPVSMLHYTIDRREMRRIFCVLARADEEPHRFIDWGEPDCRLGPGDEIGTSYAFDLYDFAIGKYRYRI